MMDNLPPNNELGYLTSKPNKKNVIYALGSVLFLIIFYILFLSAPSNFPIGAVIRIEPGMGLRSISSILKEQHIIRSRVVFESFVIIFGGEKHVVSADYLFENKSPVWRVARRIEKGEHNMAPTSVTIPEGYDFSRQNAS